MSFSEPGESGRRSSATAKGRPLRMSMFRAAPSFRNNPFLTVSAMSRKNDTVRTSDNRLSASDEKEDAPELKMRYWETMKEESIRLFIKNLPHEFIVSLPPWWQFAIGGVIYAAIFTIAFMFFWQTLQSELNKEYLSPTFNSNKCNIVQKPADGSFLADIKGNWEGVPSFNPSLSFYKAKLTNFTSASYSSSYEEFKNLFGVVQETMDVYIRKIFTSQNLAANLVYLCNFIMAAPIVGIGNVTNDQIFQLAGNPASVFNLQHIAAGLGDGEGLCGVPSTASFNPNDFKWTLTWDYLKFINDSNCMRSLKPTDMGYVEELSKKGEFSIKIDVRSYMATVAANSPLDPNLGMRSFAEDYFDRALRLIEGTQLEQLDLGHGTDLFGRYDVGKYIDYRYPGMDPIVCISRPKRYHVNGTATKPRCMFIFSSGAVFGYPYFDHFGANKAYDITYTTPAGRNYTSNFNKPYYCSCSSPYAHGTGGWTSDYLSDPIDTYGIKNCNQFDFLHGFAVFDFSSFGASFLHMLFAAENSLATSTVNKRGYKAAWYTVPQLRSDNDQELFYYEMSPRSPEKRAEDFEFCHTPYGNCSLLMLRSTNDLMTLGRMHTINDNFVQYSNGSCNFDILTPAFSELKENPPVPLQERYYVCSNSVQEALIQAVGNAFGNTAIMIPIVVIVFIHLLFMFQWITGYYIPRTYTEEEKNEVMSGIATKLLVLRDSRHRYDEHESKTSLLRSLLAELQDTHEVDNVYFLREHEKLRAAVAKRKRKVDADANWTATLATIMSNVRSTSTAGDDSSRADRKSSHRPQKSLGFTTDNPLQRAENGIEMSASSSSASGPSPPGSSLASITRRHMHDGSLGAEYSRSRSIVPFRLPDPSSRDTDDEIPVEIDAL